MVHREELAAYLNETLDVHSITDYAPNGLQVEGRDEIRRLVTGVSVSQALFERAVQAEADAILVHHGFFWKGEESRIVGLKAQRLRRLLSVDLNLFAYHLPLDVHPEFGNNAGLAELLECTVEQRVTVRGIPGLLWLGRVATPVTAAALAERLAHTLGQQPVRVGAGTEPIRRIAWCSGGGERLIEEAIAHGAEAFISGELSEPITHIAREAGVHFFAAGHHATERCGVQRLGEHIAATFGIAHEYIEIPNPA
ncbi:Nif3-like dinuclear metal center hexameric protein [Halorhodospira abdelmalekii]|uniref:Nif3-like dinuclear metal center hexameric protein n=1 Tax=Halorhodospira abdelmalekii TaxID=421629 RepID=UPI001908EE3D|nr:Nif3-like dinuclear metal center hexameric protein [Halorhodospira abdelmalekii]MBK1734098.1 Nif3-like dinuclear metal center hexameric protein [Halorhodospira abdelmalekii]